jgi:hypothetical protein
MSANSASKMAQDPTQDRGTAILVAMWTTTSIATIFVAARLYTRTKIVRSLGLDDYLISLSIVRPHLVTSALASLIILAARPSFREPYDSFRQSWRRSTC